MAFGLIFNDVGVGEWFVLLAVVLVVVGPRHLPEVARTLGRWYSRICRATSAFKRQLMEMESELNSAADSAANGLEHAFTVEDTPVKEPQGADNAQS